MGVHFDADHMCDATDEKIGQAARSAAHFQDNVVRPRFRRSNQTPHEIAVDQKMLAETLAWAKSARIEQCPNLPLGLDRVGGQPMVFGI